MEVVKQTQAAREDLGVLAVLEAVAGDARLSQRELSRRTGLNLKKVNYCLRRLLEKGHVKFQRALDSPDKRAYLYVLTPSGLQARTRLTYRFVRLTLALYEELEARLGVSGGGQFFHGQAEQSGAVRGADRGVQGRSAQLSVQDIHALEQDLEIYERKYRAEVMGDLFFAAEVRLSVYEHI